MWVRLYSLKCTHAGVLRSSYINRSMKIMFLSISEGALELHFEMMHIMKAGRQPLSRLVYRE